MGAVFVFSAIVSVVLAGIAFINGWPILAVPLVIVSIRLMLLTKNPVDAFFTACVTVAVLGAVVRVGEEIVYYLS